jgi:hypothetical protein
MRERSGFGFILTGLILGLGMGLLISLVFSPIRYSNITPAMLGKTEKDAYRALIAASYNARGDLGRAKARLALIEDPNPAQVLAAQAQKTVAEGGLNQEARGLAYLAAALSDIPVQISTEAQQPVITPTTTVTEFPTLPPLVTEENSVAGTPTPITVVTTQEVIFPTLESTEPVGDPYILKDRQLVCDLEASNLLEVYVIDKAGQPVPGVQAIITWQGGEEDFYTGLKPQIDLGYADYLMDPETLYNLRLSNGSETATKITPPNCKLDSGMAYKGGVKIIFGLP